jgi:hypothetical protein
MVKLSSDFDYSIVDFVIIFIECHYVCVIDQCTEVFKQWWQNKLTSFLLLHATSPDPEFIWVISKHTA